MKPDVLVIRAGVSGSHAAAFLQARGIACRVAEARDRIGGRALSRGAPDERPGQPPPVSRLAADPGPATLVRHGPCPAHGRPQQAGDRRNRRVFAGTETAPERGRHPEGARLAARRAADEVAAACGERS